MVKQTLITTFIDEIYMKPPKKNYLTNKTIVKHIDDTWSAGFIRYD